MASKQLIKQIAIENEWSQIEIRRAIEASSHVVNTKDEIIECMLRHSGKSLKKCRNEIGVSKRRDEQQKKMIRSLADQLIKIPGFYDAYVPALKATIKAQAVRLADFINDKNKRGRK